MAPCFALLEPKGTLRGAWRQPEISRGSLVELHVVVTRASSGVNVKY